MADKGLKGTIAYGIAPHEGGTTTFYSNLAEGLRERGWRVLPVSVDKPFDPKFTDEHHISINTGSRNLNDKVRLFIEWAIKENINILLPMFETEMLIALPYLPQKIRCITRCANIVRSAFISIQQGINLRL